MSGIFLTFLGISASVGAVIAALVLLSPLLNKRYAAKWKYLIWIFLAVRLLIPVGGASGLREKPAQSSVKSEVDFSEDFEEDIEEDALLPVRVVVEIPPQMTTPIVAQSEKRSGITALDIAAWVWAVGGLIFLSVHIISYLRYRRRVMAYGRIVDNIDLLNEINELKRSLHIDRAVTVMKYPRAESPMMMGFIKPILVLPRVSYTAEELYFIMKHELVHLKHGDIYFKLLFVAANALHWFNPLVWIMQKEAAVDMEFSCDERVIKDASIDVRKAYTETLMSTIHKRFSKKNVLSTQFYGGKKIMKKRFRNILTKKTKKSGISVLICAVTLALYLGTIVGCTTEKKPSKLGVEDNSGMNAQGNANVETNANMERNENSDGIATAEEIANKALTDLEDDHMTTVAIFTMNMTEPVNLVEGVDQLGNLREIDGVSYIPMKEDYDTLDEIMDVFHRVYTEEKCAKLYSNYLDDTGFMKEVDGKLYCIGGGNGYTHFNMPIESAESISGTEILANTSVTYDFGDIPYEITLKYEDGKWKIDKLLQNGTEYSY